MKNQLKTGALKAISKVAAHEAKKSANSECVFLLTSLSYQKP